MEFMHLSKDLLSNHSVTDSVSLQGNPQAKL